jgi:hypothetical protein
MKKIILLIPMMLAFVKSWTQFTLEHTYHRSLVQPIGQEFFLTNLGNENYKYVMYDYDSTKFHLYNLDHTPFMLNISTQVLNDPASGTYYHLGYITTELFDCDSTNIEFAMMLNTPRPAAHPNFGVYRTDGTVLFSKDTVGTIFSVGMGSGSYEMHPIMKTPEGSKLLLFNETGPIDNIFVYSLCGTLPTQIKTHDIQNNFVKVFPNPGFNEVGFEISNPNHSEKVELVIFNSVLVKIKTIQIRDANSIVYLNDDSIVAGTYFFTLQSRNNVYQTGKFIIAK